MAMIFLGIDADYKESLAMLNSSWIMFPVYKNFIFKTQFIFKYIVHKYGISKYCLIGKRPFSN
ncbi:hypothetical protein C6359_06895 [Bacillus wiedmannii]|nr:hypothetical protein C6358_06835 [Bacillus wiedmannii]PRT45275.1 hypothetical protein C6359_06895 [Bacillus wiedmannii]